MKSTPGAWDIDQPATLPNRGGLLRQLPAALCQAVWNSNPEPDPPIFPVISQHD